MLLIVVVMALLGLKARERSASTSTRRCRGGHARMPSAEYFLGSTGRQSHFMPEAWSIEYHDQRASRRWGAFMLRLVYCCPPFISNMRWPMKIAGNIHVEMPRPRRCLISGS